MTHEIPSNDEMSFAIFSTGMKRNRETKDREQERYQNLKENKNKSKGKDKEKLIEFQILNDKIPRAVMKPFRTQRTTAHNLPAITNDFLFHLLFPL